MFKKYSYILMFVALAVLWSFKIKAYNEFHPEALETLEMGKTWAEVTFEKKDTGTKMSFRAWIPYPADQVWKVLIDTNAWKDQHSDYTDSRSLDENQFKLVQDKKPTDIKAFYALVGGQIFPSDLYRRSGKVWTSYALQRFNLPFPLKDRWNVMKITNDESNAKKGEYRYDYKIVAGNFKELKGYWALLPVPGKPDLTEFRGEYKADPGISVPKFLAKSIYKASMKRSVSDKVKALDHLAGKNTESKKLNPKY